MLKISTFCILLLVSVQLAFSAEEAQSEKLYPITDRSRDGFINHNGDVVIKAKYGYVKEFSEGLALAFVYATKDLPKHYVFIDESGKVVAKIPFEAYSKIRSFRNGRAIVSKNDLFGAIDRNGNEVIPLKYAFIGDFSENRARFLENGRMGYIDEMGKIVIKPQFDPGQYKYYSYMGVFHFDNADFSEGLAAVNKNGEYGYIDISGTTVIPFKYTFARPFKNEFAVVSENNKIVFINKRGERQLSTEYQFAFNFSEGFAVVGHDDKFGFIDQRGNEITDIIFENARGFENGVAYVKQNGSETLIDTTGKPVIPLGYNSMYGFHGKIALAKKDGVLYFINKSGRVEGSSELIEYRPLLNQSSNLIRINVCREVAYLDDNLKIIWPKDISKRCRSIDTNQDYDFCELNGLTEFDKQVICSFSEN